MKTKLKLITVTALGTTLFWIALVGLLLSTGRKIDRIEAQFLAHEGALGMFYGTNTKTQNVILVVEELSMDTNATTGAELLRREVVPKQGLRIGIRELAAKSK